MCYFLCPGWIYMRKVMSSLCGVIRECMGYSVKNGDVFFIGSSRKLTKFFYAEDRGLVMFVKRLKASRFKMPSYDKETKFYPMEWRYHVVVIEGI